MSLSSPEREWSNRRVELFQTTHWSVVLLAGRRVSGGSAAALEELCRAYWYPLYSYIRRRGYGVPEAQDLTQEFFARMLSKDWLAQAEPARGRFRSFLLASLNHFLANEWRRAQCQKRGGEKSFISLDDTAEGHYALEAVTEATPELAFDRQWALMLLQRALEQLRAEFAQRGRERTYDLLKDYLWQQGSAAAYQRASEQLKLSCATVSSLVFRLRQRYQELVRQEVADTVADPSEVDAELHSLMCALNAC
jgi:RNA polymerase sigma-70 factor (ECF subfamily)